MAASIIGISKRLFLGFLCVLLLLLCFCTIRTVLLAPPPFSAPVCDQSDVDFIKADAKVLNRFSVALQHKTVTWAPGKFNLKELKELHQHIFKSYKLVHSSPLVHYETVNEHSLLYEVSGSDPSLQPYMLAGHLDVVPAENVEDWEVEPFSGKVDDKHIWGRGAIDAKEICFGILEALEFLLANGFQPLRTFYIAFGHDEEVLGTEGAGEIAKLLKARHVDRLLYILDEGMTVIDGVVKGIQGPYAIIGSSEKGYLSINFSVSDTPGHSSMPSPETAVGILSKAIGRLEENPQPSMFGFGQEKELFLTLSPLMSPPLRVVMSNLWLFGPLVARQLSKTRTSNALVRTTTALTMIHGGVKVNVLPAHAWATVNHRIHPAQTVDEVIEIDKQTMNDPRIQISVIESRAPSPISPADGDTFGFQVIKKSIQQVFEGIPVAPGTMIANTDTRHYLDFTDQIYRFTPAYNRPEDVSRYHGNNERISIKNYEQAVNFYYHVIKNSDESELLGLHKHGEL